MRIASGVCLAFLFLTGCDEFDLGSWDRYREDFHFSYPLSAGAAVELDNFNGSVEISGWDKNTIDIDGTKYASSEERMRQIKIDVTPTANAITIRTSRPMDRFGNAGARYVIHVPRRAELARIVTSNGPVRVDSIDGNTHLKTSNGTIHATGLQGTLAAETSNGGVELSDVKGDTTIRTSNGSIRADLKKGGFEGHTSNGSITAHVAESDSKPVRLESSNGRIELTMDAAREVHADTSNSSITVRMPGSIGANLRAHTSNGSISSDFGVTTHGSLSKHHLEGAIGEGGPQMDLGTSNGSIKLVRL
jgi:Putative adhesin